jgi:hypothetical protein
VTETPKPKRTRRPVPGWRVTLGVKDMFLKGSAIAERVEYLVQDRGERDGYNAVMWACWRLMADRGVTPDGLIEWGVLSVEPVADTYRYNGQLRVRT